MRIVDQLTCLLLVWYPNQGLGLQASNVVVLFGIRWAQLRWDAIIHFVDRDGIDVDLLFKLSFLNHETLEHFHEMKKNGGMILTSTDTICFLFTRIKVY